MFYPNCVRLLLSRLPLPVEITGRSAAILPIFDKIFGYSNRNSDIAEVRIDGAAMHLDLTNPSERLMFYAPHNLFRSYRRSELFSVMQAVALQSKAAFVDIGANLGMYSLLARSLGMEPILFEPEPVHASYIARNSHLFPRLKRVALSDSFGNAEFFVSSATNPGASSLVMTTGGWDGSPYKNSVVVETRTWDSIFESELSQPPISLIKIDVEGAEEQVIRGMHSYLKRDDAAPIWCEVRGPNSDRGENNYLRIIKSLATYGYAPYRSKNGIRSEFEKALEQEQVFDLLFLRKVHSRLLH